VRGCGGHGDQHFTAQGDDAGGGGVNPPLHRCKKAAEVNPAELAFFAEALNVFGAFVEGHDVAALHKLADLADDVGIRKGGDVTGIHVVGNSSEDAAHDFAGASFGHVGDDMDAFGASDFADHGFNGGGDLFEDGLFRQNAGL
jgi:hypothetical protein